MTEKIKLWLTYKIPLWGVLVIIGMTLSVWEYFDPKPPKTLIPIKLEGAERIASRTSDTFIREYLYIDILEYRSIYRIIYGKLTKEEEELFDKTLKKL